MTDQNIKKELEALKQNADDWAKSNKKSIEQLGETLKQHTKIHLRTLDILNKIMENMESNNRDIMYNKNYVKQTYPLLKATANKVFNDGNDTNKKTEDQNFGFKQI